MIPEIGHFALILAFTLALVQSVLPLWGAQKSDARLMATGPATALGQLFFVALAFAALTAAYVQSDFSVLNVWQNSHSAKPLIYKVTGVWGNHEGSMLLWILILVMFGALVAMFGANLPDRLKATVLSVQAWLTVLFLSFVLATSNPFARLDPAPIQGRDLNPLLQDIGLAVHPPLLYIGYVGFSITFAFAVAALIQGRIDAAWARWVRPWTLVAWAFLTLGISIGSYWAYYELGWGGWWFWDPVENASFLPWLSGTALLHSALVMERRNALKIWTVLLAILTFGLSMLGTFLVRSGVLTSVHSFAVDPERGLFILMILTLTVGGALSLFAIRAKTLEPGGLFAPISREGALIYNNLMLTTACGVVLIGTLYPLALEAITGDKITVGPPFFDATFGPLMIPLLLAMPLGPFLAWKRGDLYAASQRLFAALALTIVVIVAVYAIRFRGPVLAPLGIGLGAWLIFGALSEIAERSRLMRASWQETWRRLRGLPGSAWGSMLGHAGIGITVLGIVAVTAWESENIAALHPGESADIAGYDFTFQGLSPRRGPNWNEIVGSYTVSRDGARITEMETSRRVYVASDNPMTQTSQYTMGFSQLYVALGEQLDNGAVIVRLYHKPHILLIWLGTFVMFAGAACSLADRRLRVGVPLRRARRMAAAPAE
jgi:cytochrome c-type biogenesis protein CcmF